MMLLGKGIGALRVLQIETGNIPQKNGKKNSVFCEVFFLQIKFNTSPKNSVFRGPTKFLQLASIF